MFMSLTFIENGSERNKFMEAQDLWTEVPENGQMDVLLAALRAAAEPTRLRIVALLTRGELTVSELVHILGQSQPRISRHLKLLTEAGLLTRHREGSWVFHRLAESGPGAEVAQHLNALLPDEGVRDHVLSRDRERLGEVKRQRADFILPTGLGRRFTLTHVTVLIAALRGRTGRAWPPKGRPHRRPTNHPSRRPVHARNRIRH